MTILGGIVAFAAGAVGWTLTEYVLHRFDFHARVPRTRMARLHLAHHADPTFFAPWWAKLQAFALVVPPLAVAGYLATGAAGVIAALGFGITYLVYEVVHRRIHTHPPAGPYSAWARRHHLAHHYVDPSVNHGVLTSFWDWGFGSLRIPKTVRVPRRRAPAWLLAREGEIPGYTLVGRPAPEGDRGGAAPRRSSSAPALTEAETSG